MESRDGADRLLMAGAGARVGEASRARVVDELPVVPGRMKRELEDAVGGRGAAALAGERRLRAEAVMVLAPRADDELPDPVRVEHRVLVTHCSAGGRRLRRRRPDRVETLVVGAV